MRQTFWDIQYTWMLLIGFWAWVVLLVGKLRSKRFRRLLFGTSHADEQRPRRGLVSDALLRHLPLVASVPTALISTAVVALVFAHSQARATALIVEVDKAMADQIVGNFHTGWTIVFAGVGGLLYAAGAFALNALAVSPAPHASAAHGAARWTERLRVATARWCAMSAGISAVVAVWNVPKLLQTLLDVMAFPVQDVGP